MSFSNKARLFPAIAECAVAVATAVLALTGAALAAAEPLGVPPVEQAGFEVEGRTVRIAWEAPSLPVTGYTIEVKTPLGDFKALTVNPITATAFDITSALSPDKTSVFRVVTVVAGKGTVFSKPLTFRWVRPAVRAYLGTRPMVGVPAPSNIGSAPVAAAGGNNTVSTQPIRGTVSEESPNLPAPAHASVSESASVGQPAHAGPGATQSVGAPQHPAAQTNGTAAKTAQQP